MANERKNNLFKQVPIPKVKRNLFDLSHEVKMSGKFGYLYPVLCMDTLPGDTIRDAMNVMIRLAPMLSPVMHRLDVTTHFFFVPNRLLSDHWEDFITGGRDGLAAPILPYVTPAGLSANGVPGTMSVGSVWDYLGIPPIGSTGAAPAVYGSEHISALPFRALGKIWNDYYRDPNLQDEMELNVELAGDVSAQTEDAGLMTIGNYRRGFEKDYFTSALPWPQRGAEVLMPLAGVAGSADITYKDAPYGSELFKVGTNNYASSGVVDIAAGGQPGRFRDDEADSLRIENIDEITFENASTTINDFRRALAVQRWLENNARGGPRYIEQIENHFAMRVPDYRLSRAEYLGGGKQPVQISEVLATAEAGTQIVGEMSGHGLSVGRTNQFTYRCQEHGWVIGILSVTMRTAYSQGLPKMFTRTDKFDFAWPELANLGEQEILSKEVYFTLDDSADNNNVFGYIPRYAEYKFHNDRIAGAFRTTLGFWHLGRNFTSRPTLDVELTTLHEHDANEETFRRIFAVQDGTDYLWMQLYHHLTAKRPLPYFGVPQII